MKAKPPLSLELVDFASEGFGRDREDGRLAVAEIELRLLGSAIDTSEDGLVIFGGVESGNPEVLFISRNLLAMVNQSEEETAGLSLVLLQRLIDEAPPGTDLFHGRKEVLTLQTVAWSTTGCSPIEVDLRLIPLPDSGSGRKECALWITEHRPGVDINEVCRETLHDALTRLPNRSLLEDRLREAVRLNSEKEEGVAFFLVDLDRFKEINDTYGHQCGDQILQLVASRFLALVGVSETVARIGGDEFAVVSGRGCRRDEAARFARSLLVSLEEPFIVDGHTFDVTGSVGIVLCPEHGDEAGILFRRADVAMYVAKEERSGYAFYEPAKDQYRGDQLSMMLELRGAIDGNELVLHYQPKAHLKTGLVTRVEALVRWQHPVRGLLSPIEFIPLAERTGLIKPLTNWVLDEALRQCRAWHDEGLPMSIAVNLSARTLQETNLPEIVEGLLRKWSIDAHSLKLEITESAIMADPAGVNSILGSLQQLGVGFSLDDFGTGYSSLNHLRQLPFDEIKIDKSFVIDMISNENDRAIVTAMIDLAHNLGRQVVAEGVEDQATWNLLEQLGCDLVQGYFLSRPLPADELSGWLRSSRGGLALTEV